MSNQGRRNASSQDKNSSNPFPEAEPDKTVRSGLWLKNWIKNPIEVLNLQGHTLEAMKDQCNFAFDTNVILDVMRLRGNSTEFVVNTFQRLKKENRIFLPSQVLREFLRIRGTILQNAHQRLSKDSDETRHSPIYDYPLFSQNKNFLKLLEADQQLLDLIQSRKKLIQSMQSELSEWVWNDPISELYRMVFTKENVIEFDEQTSGSRSVVDIHKEFRSERRPPVIVDASKTDGGIGDLVVWLELKQLALTTKKPLVFVTNEKKEDWWQSYEKDGRNMPVFPRDELVIEMFECCGQQFSIVSLERFLSLLGADKSIIDDANRIGLENPLERDLKDNCEATCKLLIELRNNLTHLSTYDDKLAYQLIGIQNGLMSFREFLQDMREKSNRPYIAFEILDIVNMLDELFSWTNSLLLAYRSKNTNQKKELGMELGIVIRRIEEFIEKLRRLRSQL